MGRPRFLCYNQRLREERKGLESLRCRWGPCWKPPDLLEALSLPVPRPPLRPPWPRPDPSDQAAPSPRRFPPRPLRVRASMGPSWFAKSSSRREGHPSDGNHHRGTSCPDHDRAHGHDLASDPDLPTSGRGSLPFDPHRNGLGLRTPGTIPEWDPPQRLPVHRPRERKP